MPHATQDDDEVELFAPGDVPDAGPRTVVMGAGERVRYEVVEETHL